MPPGQQPGRRRSVRIVATDFVCKAPSPLPSPGGRGRSGGVTCTCIFFVEWIESWLRLTRLHPSDRYSTEIPEAAGFARLHPSDVLGTHVSLSEMTGGRAWLHRPKQHSSPLGTSHNRAIRSQRGSPLSVGDTRASYAARSPSPAGRSIG